MTPLQKPIPDWLQRLRTKAWRKRLREMEEINLLWHQEMADRCKRGKEFPTEEQQVAWDGELKARAEAGCRK